IEIGPKEVDAFLSHHVNSFMNALVILGQEGQAKSLQGIALAKPGQGSPRELANFHVGIEPSLLQTDFHVVTGKWLPPSETAERRYTIGGVPVLASLYQHRFRFCRGVIAQGAENSGVRKSGLHRRA